MEEVLGVTIQAAGCRRVRVRPQLGDLQWAEGVFPTPLGEIAVKAFRKNGEAVAEYSAPASIQIEA